MADSLNEMKNNKFEYFLNAILYCLYLNEVWSNRKIDKIVNTIIPRAMKAKLNQQEKKEAEDLKYGNEAGLSIGVANHLYGLFYSGYPVILSFIFLGFILRHTDILTPLARVVIIGLPIGLCYIPAYRAVFSNDRYLMYFKHFEKKDERWHRKWRWITIAFCIGSVSCTVLGLLMAFAIAVL